MGRCLTRLANDLEGVKGRFSQGDRVGTCLNHPQGGGASDPCRGWVGVSLGWSNHPEPAMEGPSDRHAAGKLSSYYH